MNDIKNILGSFCLFLNWERADTRPIIRRHATSKARVKEAMFTFFLQTYGPLPFFIYKVKPLFA